MLYPHRVTVKRYTRAESNGEIVPTESEAATDVEVRIEEEHGRTMLSESGREEKYHAIALMNFGTDIREERSARDHQYDELIQTTPNTSKRWKVLTVADESGTSHHLVAKLQSVQA
jgi:hypothetical protein